GEGHGAVPQRLPREREEQRRVDAAGVGHQRAAQAPEALDHLLSFARKLHGAVLSTAAPRPPPRFIASACRLLPPGGARPARCARRPGAWEAPSCAASPACAASLPFPAWPPWAEAPAPAPAVACRARRSSAGSS